MTIYGNATVERDTVPAPIGAELDMSVAANDDGLPPADRLYAARSAMIRTGRAPRNFGVAELVKFLNDPRQALSLDDQRSLFSDPRLRADFRRLKSQLAVVELPALAAASDGVVHDRRFEGGSIRVHPSRVPGQVYVVVRFTSATVSPRSLLLEAPNGELVNRALPTPDARGEIMIVLDQNNGNDAAFLRVISDPNASGTFLL